MSWKEFIKDEMTYRKPKNGWPETTPNYVGIAEDEVKFPCLKEEDKTFVTVIGLKILQPVRNMRKVMATELYTRGLTVLLPHIAGFIGHAVKAVTTTAETTSRRISR